MLRHAMRYRLRYVKISEDILSRGCGYVLSISCRSSAQRLDCGLDAGEYLFDGFNYPQSGGRLNYQSTEWEYGLPVELVRVDVRLLARLATHPSSSVDP